MKYTAGPLAPWGVVIDANDTVWLANAKGRSITQLCGARPAKCPPGLKTGDPISRPAAISADCRS
jgi:hypothetical protein